MTLTFDKLYWNALYLIIQHTVWVQRDMGCNHQGSASVQESPIMQMIYNVEDRYINCTRVLNIRCGKYFMWFIFVVAWASENI